MKVNLKKEITNMKGIKAKMSFPSETDLKKVKGDQNKLPNETVGNVLINCLATFPVENRKEVFTIHEIASKIVKSKDGKIDIEEEEKKLLGNVLFRSTYQKDPKEGKEKGVYMSYIIKAVMDVLEIKN